MPMKLENNSNSLLNRGPIGISEPTDKEFELFRKLVLKELGLEWNKDKKYLLHARLHRRLQFHKFKTFGEYYDFIEYKGPLSVEWEDAVMDREFGAAEGCTFVKSLQFPSSDRVFDEAFNE